MAADRACTDWLNARDRVWRVGQHVYLCLAPVHSTALSHPLNQQSAWGSGEGLEARQHGHRDKPQLQPGDQHNLAVSVAGLQVDEL